LIENRPYPFGIRLHVFNLAPGSTMGTGDHEHQSTARNGWIAREADLSPSHILVNAWSSVLGDDTDEDGVLNPSDNCPGQANGQQANADGDEYGDACDSTPYGTTPPTLTVPAPFTVDATGPGGATVSYAVTVTDDVPPAPPALCSPAAGSQFAIGVTTVGCSATDLGANTANASFAVTVLGAKEQLTNLTREVVESSGLPPAVKAQLIGLVAGLDPTRPLQRAVTCIALRAFAAIVPSLEWRADANRIRAVLAC
jgi:hypothetical protein